MRVRWIPPLVVVFGLAIMGAFALATGGEEPDCCAPPEQGTGPSTEDVITYFGGGGIDGQTTAIEIRPDGSATITKGVRGEETTDEFQLDPAELDELRGDLSGVDLNQLDRGEEPPCLDCIGYRIKWGGEIAEADSNTIDDAYTDVVEILSAVAERELAQGTISYERSGGVGGTNQLLVIEDDGNATITTGYDPNADPDAQVHEFDVGTDEVAALRDHLADFDLSDLNEGEDDMCGDCFVYEIGVDGEIATVDDVTQTDDFQAASAPLDAILESELPGEGPVGGG